VRGNKSIGVCRVANNEDLHILLCELIEGLTLSLENLSVLIQQIFAFHAGTTWLGTNQDSNVSLCEGLLYLGGGNDASNEGESTVLELED